jgi:hypothetical protein
MRFNMFAQDAPQQALSFLVRQGSYIESQIINIPYPDVQYAQLIPVDTSAPEWTKSVTFFSMDKVGQAAWFNHMSTDMRLADVVREKFEQTIEMAGIGYRWTMEEVAQAISVGVNLPTAKAEAAKRAYEEFVDQVAMYGDTGKNLTGLVNNASVTVTVAPSTGTGSSPDWSDKTAQQIMTDINSALTGIYVSSLTVEMADTLLLPIASMQILSEKQMDGIAMTVLEWIRKYNIYTSTTGQPLTIRAVRGLETAGTGGTGRMVAYRRDPQVVKMHIPMPHRFLPVQPAGPIMFDVPGIFRLGGVEIRRPGAVRYVDRITEAAYD